MPSKNEIDTLFEGLEEVMRRSFGENYDKAYGQGQYKKINVDWGNLNVTKQIIGGEETLLGDNVLKDVLMMFLQPLSGIIIGALNIGSGLIRAAFNILPLLLNPKESKMGSSILQMAVGVGQVLLGIVTPFARLYNIAVRLSVPVVKGELNQIPTFITEPDLNQIQVSTTEPNPIPNNSTEQYKAALPRSQKILPQNKFDEFCDKVTEMCDEIIMGADKMYDQKTTSQMDFILRMNSSTFANAIYDAFKPASVRSRSRYHCIVEFQVQELTESDSILTQQGLEAAHSKIFDNLHASVMNESGRLGKCLNKISESTGKHQDEIKEIIECRIQELQDEFTSKVTYPEKNQILIKLNDFYNEIRDEAKLKNLVTEAVSSMRPR